MFQGFFCIAQPYMKSAQRQRIFVHLGAVSGPGLVAGPAQKTLSKEPADRLLSPALLGEWAAPLDHEIVGNATWNAYNLSDASTVRIDKDGDDAPVD